MSLQNMTFYLEDIQFKTCGIIITVKMIVIINSI